MQDQMLKYEVTRAKVLEDVLAERERQDVMQGDQVGHSDEYWNVIATEENGEVARAIWENDNDHMYEEIIQEDRNLLMYYYNSNSRLR